MRVITGTARGCRLFPVSGRNTRPTTDRVKENIFNLIQSSIEGAWVLDLFAGTGQLGIEALSRGAAHCDFVEQNRKALQTVSRNLQAAHVAERATVFPMEATRFLSQTPARPYDLVFLDPPYGGILLQDALSAIERFDILAVDGIIICECAAEDKVKHSFSVQCTRRYGATMITVLRSQNGETEENDDYEDSDLSGQF